VLIMNRRAPLPCEAPPGPLASLQPAATPASSTADRGAIGPPPPPTAHRGGRTVGPSVWWRRLSCQSAWPARFAVGLAAHLCWPVTLARDSKRSGAFVKSSGSRCESIHHRACERAGPLVRRKLGKQLQRVRKRCLPWRGPQAGIAGMRRQGDGPRCGAGVAVTWGWNPFSSGVGGGDWLGRRLLVTAGPTQEFSIRPALTKPNSGLMGVMGGPGRPLAPVPR